MTGLGVAAAEVRRLDPRTLVTRLLTLAALRNQIGLFVSLLAIFGLRGGFRVAGVVAVVATIGGLAAGRAVLEWLLFSYAVDRDRLVVRRGAVRRSLTVVPLDRIRGVDVHASALQRLLGVAVVRVDAAATGGNRDEAMLDVVSRAEAERLRRVLLRQVAVSPVVPAAGPAPGPPVPGAPPVAGPPPWPGAPPWPSRTPAAEPAEEPGELLARLRPGWLLYAPLVGSYLVAPVAAFFAIQQFLDDLRIPILDRPGRLLGGRRLDPWLVTGTAAVVLAGCLLGAVATAAVTNWGFTLTRRAGALVTERGLLSRRQVSLELARIRGYALVESLPLRAAGAARLLALVTGLGGENGRRGQLLPLGPARVAREVAAAAVLSFTAPLRRHPAAARRRRLVRAVLPWLLLAVPLAVLRLWPAVAGALALGALGVPLGLDRYRGLGHGLDPAAICVRSGSLRRRQVVLARGGVVGWRVRQSFFQRRAGLATVTVATGAGAGGYHVIDLAAPDAVGLMTAVSPGQLAAVTLPDQGHQPGHTLSR